MLNRSEVPPTTLHIAPYMLPLYLAKPDDAILVAAGALVQDELLVVGARLPVSVGDAEVDALQDVGVGEVRGRLRRRHALFVHRWSGVSLWQELHGCRAS